MDPALVARYPFLPEAARAVREEGPAIEDLLTGRAWQAARLAGKDRVLAAVEADPVPPAHARGDHEAMLAILGYVVARLLVSCVDDKLLVNRYATSEARGLGEVLAKDTDEALLAVAFALGVPVEPREGRFAVPFQAFLASSRDIKAVEWKLVNQDLARGHVLLGRGRFTRLVQEAFKHRLLDELPLDVPPVIAEHLAPWPQEIGTRLAEARSTEMEVTFDKVAPEVFPPCIKALIGSIRAGENVSHEGRFATVAFLNTIGMERDAIIEELFVNVPDFAKEITEYQVDHIVGRKGHEAYTPPGCQSLQTYGLCPMFSKAKDDWDRWCSHEKMGHPLTYYRWGLFKLGKQEGSEEP